MIFQAQVDIIILFYMQLHYTLGFCYNQLQLAMLFKMLQAYIAMQLRLHLQKLKLKLYQLFDAYMGACQLVMYIIEYFYETRKFYSCQLYSQLLQLHSQLASYTLNRMQQLAIYSNCWPWFMSTSALDHSTTLFKTFSSGAKKLLFTVSPIPFIC